MAKIVLLVVAALALVATLLTGVVVLVGHKSRTEAAAQADALVADVYTATDGAFRAEIDRAPRTTSIPVTLPGGSSAFEVDYLFQTSPTSGIVVYVVPVGADRPAADLRGLALEQLTQRGMTIEQSSPTTFAGHRAVTFRGRWDQGGDTYLVDGRIVAPAGRVVVVIDNERIDTPGAGGEARERFVATFELGPFGGVAGRG